MFIEKSCPFFMFIFLFVLCIQLIDIMPTAKKRAADKIKQNLFLPTEEIKDQLTAFELERKKRIMFCITQKLDDPIISDKELVKHLTTGCTGACKAVSQPTAYRDLLIINNVAGNIRNASKEWLRYMVIEIAKEEIKTCRGKDGKAVAALLKVIHETGQLGKDDIDDLASRMTPPDWTFTDDVRVLGENIEVLPDADERRKELRTFFNKKEIQEVNAIDITDEEGI